MSEPDGLENRPPASSPTSFATSNLPSKFVPPAPDAEPSTTRPGSNSVASNVSRRIRRLSRSFEESNLPEGFFHATADIASSLVAGGEPRSPRSPTRRSTSMSPTGVPEGAATNKPTSPSPGEGRPPLDGGAADTNGVGGTGRATDETARGTTRDGPVDNRAGGQVDGRAVAASSDDATLHTSRGVADVGDAPLCEPFDNGYHFPPKYSAKDSFRHGMAGFWRYFTTPLGFCVVVYGLNVVAWGGMLFLLLCNASPAMCYPTCGDINSPRRKWIEWDSQILNALFCVTGLGLAPWRFRDMYYLFRFRVLGEHVGLRRLAGIHRGWFRLQGSQDLPVDVGPDHIPEDVPPDAVPYPESKIPAAPLTGRRAPPTKLWKLDFILWMNVGNTFMQCCLCGFMWGMNRYVRPSWSTGLFVALACVVGAIGGLGMFFEGKRVKSIEGVPLTDEDKEKLAQDTERGIYHYNNIKAKKPKEEVGDPESNTERVSSKR